MSETKWTREQQAAISEKGCNLLVAAAAGAGKTAVLVERIIRKIIDENEPVDIDSLLVVTFTNAAATEMRERIGAAITKAIEEKRATAGIHRQLALLSKASITTIHSFCLEVIKNNFQSIDIDPGFRILDETEASLLKLEILNDLFEDIYEEDNTAFFDLLEAYGSNRDDQKLQDMVLSIYSFVQSYPWPEKWLIEQAESFNSELDADFGCTPWGRILLEAVRLDLEGFKALMETACLKMKYAVGFEKYIKVFYEDNYRLQELLSLFESGENQHKGRLAVWDDIFTYITNYEFDRLPSCGKDADKKIQDKVKQTRDELKAYIKNLREEVFLSNSEDILSDLKSIYPLLKCISNLVIEFGRRYSERKKSKAAVDFNDLEHFCLKILSETDDTGAIVPTKVAKAYKEKFTEILVDEYQDSNYVQEIIISMISREDMGTPNVFMVGDVKQSIYRFRQAKPELFMRKYNLYSADSEGLFRKILLFKNFRSRKEVVEGVNYIFKQIMSQSVGELDYSDKERLNPGAAFPQNEDAGSVIGGEVELHIIETSRNKGYDNSSEDTDEEAESEEEEEILDNIQQEARMVAGRIVELLQPDSEGRKFKVWDKKIDKYRDLEFRDIVILLRTTKNWTEVFCEELALSGIPTFADTGSGFFKTSEVQVVLSLLQIIDNPYQDIPLLSVLRSPIVNFDTNDLAELRLQDKNAALFDALNLLAKADTIAGSKAFDFLGRLKQWRSFSHYMPTHKLIWQLYNETGYFSIVGAMTDGERKQANLRVLFERALQYEKTSFKGLFNFISFVDKLKTGKGDLGSAKILGENDDVVRLMSIHKSKGLEFPVVFVSGCGKKFNFQDMFKSILLHQELGFGPEFVDYRRRIKYPSVPKLAIAQKVRLETLSEEMRILYVALTRAREKLILTGAVGNLEKAAVKWLATAGGSSIKFPPHEMAKARNYLDWVCPSVMRHKNALNLRMVAGEGFDIEPPAMEDTALWKVYIRTLEDVTVSKRIERIEEEAFDIENWLQTNVSTEKINEDIDKRLSWKYPYREMTGIPSKLSVTEIKRYFNINNESEDSPVPKPVGIRKPGFLQARKGLSPAEKGTVMHFVMQHIDLKNPNIEGQLLAMVEKDLITKQQSDAVDVAKISRFIASKIGQRIVYSDRVYREVPFNLELSYGELYGKSDTDHSYEETILLQGVIDCYFEEAGKLVLLDYKTDFIEGSSYDIIKERYGIQLSYYSRALEKLTGLKVAERYVYLFSTGELVDM